MNINQYNINWVINHLDNGFLFFWGHQPSKDGSITKSCLSQWWTCSFKVDQLTYSSTEQYMMACKARLFEDHEIAEKIMNSTNPKEIKQLGRYVSNFDASVWDMNKYQFVVESNFASLPKI